MNTSRSLVILGAGGKMGCRIVDHLQRRPDYRLTCIETGAAGQARLAARGIVTGRVDEALADAEVVLLALPDRALGPVARELVPRLRAGTLVFALDPAAAHAGEFPPRPDVGYFVSHPCHPSVFEPPKTREEMDDFFGGTHAPQAIVCALMQGPDEQYALGEQVARDIFAPVTRSHRITVEQMALLEPTMAETVSIGLFMAMREALEEVVRRGVPRAAAEDFLFGHIKVELGIAFGRAGFPFSDGAQLIGRYGTERLLRPDWKRLFEPESVREQVRLIVAGAASAGQANAG